MAAVVNKARGVWALAALALLLGSTGYGQAKTRAASLRVTGAEPGAFVIVDGVRFGRVNDTGTRLFASIPAGSRTVVIRQAGYADAVHRTVLAAGRPVTLKPKKIAIADEAEHACQRAEVLAAEGKHEHAVTLYQQAIASRSGNYPAASAGMARSLITLKRTDEAVQALQPVLAAHPRNLDAHTVAANALRESGLYEDALAAYRKAIAIAPDRSPEAHTGLAMILADRGDSADAVAEFRKAIAQNLDAEPILYQMLGAALERMDSPQQAIDAYERFLSLAPKHSLATAVRSVVDRLRARVSDDTSNDGEDVNPYAPPN